MRGARVSMYVVSSTTGDKHEDQTAYRSGSAWNLDPGRFQHDFSFDSVGHAYRQSGECRIDKRKRRKIRMSQTWVLVDIGSRVLRTRFELEDRAALP